VPLTAVRITQVTLLRVVTDLSNLAGCYTGARTDSCEDTLLSQSAATDAAAAQLWQQQKFQEERLTEAARIIEELSAVIRRDLRLEEGLDTANECWPALRQPLLAATPAAARRSDTSSSASSGASGLNVSLQKAVTVRRAMHFAAQTAAAAAEASTAGLQAPSPSPSKGVTKREALMEQSPNVRA
jgi:hypothetical protein